jgi:polyhydroxyalkanoate synthesis regulator phasin
MNPILVRVITVGAVLLGLAGATGGALALGLNPLGSAQAASTPKPADTQEYCNKFMSYLAQGLGKSGADLRAGLQSAGAKTIDDAVKAGDLSAAQAATLKQKLSKQSICSADLSGLGKHAPLRFSSYRNAYLDAAAKTVGMTPKALRAALAKGTYLHQMADSKNLSQSAFRSSLIENITPVLDARVKAGKLTKDHEQQILTRLQTGQPPLWDKPTAGPASKP